MIYFSTRSLEKELEAKVKKEAERKETERILREYQENDPVTLAFKRLEAEEKQKKRNISAGMYLGVKGIWDGSCSEVVEVKNFAGDTAIRYCTCGEDCCRYEKP